MQICCINPFAYERNPYKKLHQVPAMQGISEAAGFELSLVDT